MEQSFDFFGDGFHRRHEALAVGVREEEHLHRVTVVDGNAAASDLSIDKLKINVLVLVLF